jgi:predicted Zn-dependent protease with MMP-like domain
MPRLLLARPPARPYVAWQMANSQTLAPDAAQIEAIARATLAGLPAPFGRHLDGVVLRVLEFADDETLEALHIEDPFQLSGLYRGLTVGAKADTPSGAQPDMIELYRRALLDEWIEAGETLEALVAHVVIHEIGHHFGLSDDDMHALEEAAGG